MQEEIVRSIVEDKSDTIALLPTGGGKSVCFQVPALAMEGICLVISPLIALMNDQVDQLRSLEISAYSLAGELAFAEIDRILDKCVRGEVKFLYLSPERLQTKLIQERVSQMKVCLLAIDEAHCVSQWGYDFRPSYLNILEIRRYIPGVPCLALTASATIRVVDDISDKLQLDVPKIFRKSFFRENLSLFLLHTEKRGDYLLKVLNKNPGSGLVYVSSRKDAKVVADFIVQHGFSADYYHAGLKAHERALKQKQWIENKTRVIVCTNAFGMGIDKPDVRFVVHWGMSSSLEAYYQEAGRAGRDGKKSFAVALVRDGDLDQIRESVVESFPEKALIKRVYSLLGSYYQTAYGSGKEVFKSFDISDFAKYCKFPPKQVHNSLEILKQDGFILLNDAFFQPSRILFLMGQKRLYEFQVFNPKFEPLLKLLLRSYSGVFEELVRIDEWMLARKLDITVDFLRAQLRHLSQLEVIEYSEQHDESQIAFATERLVENNFQISEVAYEQRRQVMQAQVNSVLDYAADKNKCRFQMICEYFDEEDSPLCGHCDHCLENLKDRQLSKEEVQESILNLLKFKEMTASELKHHADLRFHDEMVDEMLSWLLGQEMVALDENRRFVLKSWY